MDQRAFRKERQGTAKSAPIDFQKLCHGRWCVFGGRKSHLVISADEKCFADQAGTCGAEDQVINPGAEPVPRLESCTTEPDDPTAVDGVDLAGERKRAD